MQNHQPIKIYLNTLLKTLDLAEARKAKNQEISHSDEATPQKNSDQILYSLLFKRRLPYKIKTFDSQAFSSFIKVLDNFGMNFF